MDAAIHHADVDFVALPAPVGDLLDDAARRFAGHPAVDFLGRGQTWGTVADLADRAAAGLQALGVGKGVCVGLCLPNTPYSVILYFAILKAGGTVVNFNPLYTERELAGQIKDSGTRMIVTLDLAMIQAKIGPLVDQGLLDRVIVCSMADALPLLKAWLFRAFKARDLAAIPDGKAYLRFDELIAGAAKPTPVVIDPIHDIAVLQYTGGTTGTPKAAMLTHGNITANIQQVLAASPTIGRGTERIIGVLPLFHVFAMTAVMNLGVAIGAELILMPRLDMKLLMTTITRKRPTMLPGVPTLYTAICNAAGGGTDLSFIKFCMSGGAPMSLEGMERFEHLSRCPILEGYGLSETSPIVTATRPDHVKIGSVGQALPGTMVEIRDPDHPEVVLAQGARGEICVRGPQVMRGYYHRPEETAASFVNGALRTGDIGYLDEDGHLFIVDRIKDLILCGGFNVYPRVIEEAAYQHPSVQDAVAIGIPDGYRGQAPKLFVTLRPGTAATEAEILQFLKTHLNRIEIPKTVEIRESLPKTMVGKLSKKELVAEEVAKAQAKI
ncbi:long-chain fatty acid--CoA ligase [Acidiphilium sp. PA]|uniref:long-chain-fatty-acid--CoA ligase n=1 Tax=Acidiphilium sp. PA TaxID=2871705 RepID=UPI002244BDB2|nr:long-chain fatty acid--CoA ligase [Acidiphilium sp. PA]MCW8307676.1 long-chain fatty acid--CoA ligase [Acidiphilium sp. PA]